MTKLHLNWLCPWYVCWNVKARLEFYSWILLFYQFIYVFSCFVLQTSNKATLIAYCPLLIPANWTNHYTFCFAKQIMYPTKSTDQFSYYVRGVIESIAYLVIGNWQDSVDSNFFVETTVNCCWKTSLRIRIVIIWNTELCPLKKFICLLFNILSIPTCINFSVFQFIIESSYSIFTSICVCWIYVMLQLDFYMQAKIDQQLISYVDAYKNG